MRHHWAMTYTDRALDKALGEEIYSARVNLPGRVKQSDIYEAAGLSKSAYLKLENGQPGTKRTVQQLRVIAEALGMTLGELVTRAERRARNADQTDTSG